MPVIKSLKMKKTGPCPSLLYLGEDSSKLLAAYMAQEPVCWLSSCQGHQLSPDLKCPAALWAPGPSWRPCPAILRWPWTLQGHLVRPTCRLPYLRNAYPQLLSQEKRRAAHGISPKPLSCFCVAESAVLCLFSGLEKGLDFFYSI